MTQKLQIVKRGEKTAKRRVVREAFKDMGFTSKSQVVLYATSMTAVSIVGILGGLPGICMAVAGAYVAEDYYGMYEGYMAHRMR